MSSLRELTEEYLGSLKYAREVAREVALPLGLRDIVAVVGPRRAGKTFLMLKAAEKLLRSGGRALAGAEKACSSARPAQVCGMGFHSAKRSRSNL
jgi:ABC-type branched-subunit amino acid transport system ATPase component